MPSHSHLGLKMLVEHLANTPPEAPLTASDTALDHMIGQGGVNAVMTTANLAPEKRDRFMRNVVKLIENDLAAPIEHSLARLTWLMPALQARDLSDPTIDTITPKRSQNLFEQMAALAAMQDNFDAQIQILGLSNNVPISARGILAPINALGLSYAIDHAFRASRNALLTDAAPFKQFKSLAERSAKLCDLASVEDGDEMLEDFDERIASLDILIRKFRLPQESDTQRGPDQPPRSGRRRKTPKPRRDPP